MKTPILALAALIGCAGDADKGDGDGPGDSGAPTTDTTPPPGEITLTSFSAATQSDLAFVAFRDGSGAWETADGQGGRYTFPVSGSSYALAWVCAEAGGFVRVRTLYALSTEIADLRVHCLSGAPDVALSGTVTGLGASEGANVSVGWAYTSASAASPTYAIDAYGGATDAVAARTGPSGTDRVSILRGVPLFGSSGTVNFDLTTGAETVPFDVTVDGAPPVNAVYGGLATARASTAYLGATAGAVALAEGDLDPGDIQWVTGYDFDAAGLFRSATRYFRAPGDLDLVLPDAADASAISATTDPYVRLTGETDADADIVALSFMSYPSASLFWYVEATAGWRAENGDTLETPDLSTFPAWDPAWAYAAGGTFSWYAYAYSGATDVATLYDRARYEPATADLEGYSYGMSQRNGLIEP